MSRAPEAVAAGRLGREGGALADHVAHATAEDPERGADLYIGGAVASSLCTIHIAHPLYARFPRILDALRYL